MMKRDDDLRRPFWQTLAGAQIERYALPAPIGHFEAHGYERFDTRALRDTFDFFVAEHILAIMCAVSVLPESDGVRIDRADRPQHLRLLISNRFGIERGRHFHRR